LGVAQNYMVYWLANKVISTPSNKGTLFRVGCFNGDPIAYKAINPVAIYQSSGENISYSANVRPVIIMAADFKPTV